MSNLNITGSQLPQINNSTNLPDNEREFLTALYENNQPENFESNGENTHLALGPVLLAVPGLVAMGARSAPQIINAGQRLIFPALATAGVAPVMKSCGSEEKELLERLDNNDREAAAAQADLDKKLEEENEIYEDLVKKGKEADSWYEDAKVGGVDERVLENFRNSDDPYSDRAADAYEKGGKEHDEFWKSMKDEKVIKK